MFTTEISPFQAQRHLESFVRAAAPPIFTFLAPLLHGPVVTGTQGPGTGEPRAAARAAITAGLAAELHMTKGGMLTKGMKSLTVASGMKLDVTRAIGSTTSGIGAMPWVQRMSDPRATGFGMDRWYGGLHHPGDGYQQL